MSGQVELTAFLRQHARVARVRLTEVRGSSPRNAGTEMFVAGDGLWGTIGGGQLEFLVIEEARAMLARGDLGTEMDLPLGPEIGQCCGGRVGVRITRMRRADKIAAADAQARDTGAYPHVYILGAGHVGRALAGFFAQLPVRTIVIDMRAGELAQCTAPVELRQSALPEADIAAAPPQSAFIVLTHDHGLDFLLTSEALKRADAAYVGMIGSATKRAKFNTWYRSNCNGQSTRELVCPIGAGGSPDKRPAVIAALVAAEVISALTTDNAIGVPRQDRALRTARR